MLLSGRFAVPADASDAMLLAKQSSASNRAPRARVRAAIAVSLMRRPMHCDGSCNLP